MKGGGAERERESRSKKRFSSKILNFLLKRQTLTGQLLGQQPPPLQTAVNGDGAKSALMKEKPWKSSWLMAARTSGSEGVRAGGAAVKNLSKFSPFLPP